MPESPRASAPPKEVYIGMVDGQWPVQAFTEQAHAIHWMTEKDQGEGEGRVHLWLCDLVVVREMTVLPPSAPRLVPKYEHQDAADVR